MSTLPKKAIRCAVYTRKSSEEGLDLAFNSLDAQREAGTDYIKSQKHQGWTLVETAYDDGGYSGGSTDRPGLQRLLADIEKGRIDVVVVYKVDRLSRSLADFARLMQTFDEHEVSFVSVTQQFNTTTSMGRLTLNMLLSFAQFEREVAGERIRDKIAATKRKGVWVTGQPPLGYRLPTPDDPGYVPGDRMLRIVDQEAGLVRAIYAGYIELGSLVALAERLAREGQTTRRWTSTRGKTWGGKPLSTARLHRILSNPVYAGKMTHTRSRGTTEVYEGQHQPIVDQETWDAVRARMAATERESRHRWTHTHLLKGKLRTWEGHAMSPGSVQRPVKGKEGLKRLVRYYVSQKAIKHGYRACPIKTINAAHLDDLVRGLVLDHLRKSHGLDLRSRPPEERDHLVREVVDRVEMAPDRLCVELVRSIIAECVEAARGGRGAGGDRGGRTARGSWEGRGDRGGGVNEGRDNPRSDSRSDLVPSCPFAPDVEEVGDHIRLMLCIQIKRLDGRRVLLSPEGHDLQTSVTPQGQPVPKDHVVRAIGQAYAWRRELLETGEPVEAVARRAGVTPARVHSVLTLTQLSPSLLRSVLSGDATAGLTLEELVRAGQILDWRRQERVAGPRCQEE